MNTAILIQKKIRVVLAGASIRWSVVPLFFLAGEEVMFGKTLAALMVAFFWHSRHIPVASKAVSRERGRFRVCHSCDLLFSDKANQSKEDASGQRLTSRRLGRNSQ
jgi:hypothetical protein